MDVIALHAAGFENAVATLGTAMTQDHARLFSKYTKNVVISYDSDDAGQNAANKAMRFLGEVGIDVRVLKLNGAKDPDEYIKKFGSDKFRQVLEQSKTGFEHKSERILSKYDLNVGSDKIKASSEICTLISEYWSAVEREVYLARASALLGLPKEVLKNSVEQIRRKKKREYTAKQSREALASVKNFGDRINPEAAKDPRAVSAEETVLGLLLIKEEFRNAVERGEITLDADDFVTEFHRRVFASLMRMHQSDGGVRRELFGMEFSPDEMGRIEKTEIARQQLSQNGPEVFRSAVDVLKDARKKEEMKTRSLDEKIAYLREKKAKLHKGKAD